MSKPMTPASLTIHCVSQPGDILTVETRDGRPRLPGPREPQVRIRLVEHDGRAGQAWHAVARLDKEDARKLFNWLGIWLHTT